MFRRLVAYQTQHQTTNVPFRWKEDPQLATWVATQRKTYKNETLSNERVKLLKSIDFVWKLVDHVPWMEMYQRLVAYKQQHQTTIVPQKYEEDQQLATWVHNQRVFYMKKQLSVERTNYLESIGFVWNLRNCVPWIEMYKRLVVYKQHNQSTQVPYKYIEDPSLGSWVYRQGHAFKKDNLSESRMELLNSIDFVW